MLGSVVRTLCSLFSFYFIIIFFYFIYIFVYLFIYYFYYYYYFVYYYLLLLSLLFAFLIMISPVLASGVRLGRLCWVGQGSVVLAAGGRPTNLDNARASAYCFCSRCKLGLFGYFFLSPIISLFFLPSLGWMGG